MYAFTWEIVYAEADKEEIAKKMPPITQLFVVADGFAGYVFWMDENGEVPIVGPLSNIIIIAPEMDTRVLMIVIRLLEFLKSNFSILEECK